MFLELLIAYWVLEPMAQDVDRFSYEQELMQDEIVELKEEIGRLKSSNKANI